MEKSRRSGGGRADVERETRFSFIMSVASYPEQRNYKRSWGKDGGKRDLQSANLKKSAYASWRHD